MRGYRPTLKNYMDINIFRILVHSLLPTAMGKDRDKLMRDEGKTLGASLYMSHAPASVDEAAKELTDYFRKMGLCIITKVEKLSGRRNDVLEIVLTESLTSSGLPPTGRAMCHLEGGVVEEYFSRFYGKGVVVSEPMCVSKGDPYCKIVVTLYG